MAPPVHGNGNKYFRIVFYMCVLTMLYCLYTINSTVRLGFNSALQQYASTSQEINEAATLDFKKPITPLFSDPLLLPFWASPQIIQEYNRTSVNFDGDSDSDSLPSCRLPQLQPYHPSILNLVNAEVPPLICEDHDHPLLFNATSDPSPKLIPVPTKENRSIHSCCFRKLSPGRTYTPFSPFIAEVSESSECRPVSLETETDVPAGWDFVKVECMFKETLRNVDVHAFFHDGPAKNNVKNNQKSGNSYQSTRQFRSDNQATRTESQINKRVNVMILALDSMSRMNVLRAMPEVHFFMKNNLSALEMQGYHKIGENTIPNIGPLLAKRKFLVDSSHLKLDCADEERYLDNCPLIWKKYKSAGYRTLFAEDGIQLEIFNLHKFDFAAPPTDHYFRTLTLGANKYTAHGGGVEALSKLCFGPLPAFNLMIDYMEQMALSMERTNTPFFQYAMADSVLHEFLNGVRLVVDHLLEALVRLHERGVFNNTILIILSDHGMRHDDTIRSQFQGFLEDRLPFLYIAPPPWFQSKYPAAYANLMRNTKSLITVWDIRQTLEDIVNLESIDDEKITSRQNETLNTNQEDPGISLFLPIPATRTCETAGIPEEFCVCNMKAITVPLNTPIVKAGAKYAMEHVNGKLTAYAACAELSLKNVLQAEEISTQRNSTSLESTTDEQIITYRIVFETSPGDAQFEALLRIRIKKNKVVQLFTQRGARFEPISVKVGRIDVYKNQSWCTDNKSVKPYCYCKKQSNGK